MTTTAEIATVPQINVIKGLSKQIWGSEWIVLDEYGDSEGVVDRLLAGNLIVALNEVKKLPVDRLDDGGKLDALAKVLAGEPLPEPPPPSEPEPEPLVARLIVDLPAALPAWERFEIAEEAETKRPTVKPFTGRHGTRRAFKHHQDLGEAPCDQCRAIAEPVKPKQGEQLKPIEHGSAKGYHAHRRRGEDPCDDCIEGARASWRRYQQNTKARAKSNRAQKQTVKKAAVALRPKTEVVETPPNGRPFDQILEGLFGLLPDTHETFTEEAKARWVAFARLTLDVVWPNS